MDRSLLIIDDSRAIRRILRNTLTSAGLFTTIREATDGVEGLELARAATPDLVLCDLDMPNADGFAFLRAFRADPKNENVPVLMLSGTDTSDTMVDGFALGATDYIVKPCDPAELCARVKSYLRLKVLQDQLQEKNLELEAKNAELSTMAITDPLTGLHNRRYFIERAEQELKRSQRGGHSFALLIVDVDHFKRVNDTLGHPQGDAVLVGLARVMRERRRQTDILARFGGEEFVLCLPETDEAEAAIVAEKVRREVEEASFPGVPWAVTVSIGVSAYPAHEAHSVATMLSRADAALYAAKAAGRNQVKMALPGALSMASFVRSRSHAA
jgi:diguanylate cyclase (GGDEF)-like protein